MWPAPLKLFVTLFALQAGITLSPQKSHPVCLKCILNHLFMYEHQLEAGTKPQATLPIFLFHSSQGVQQQIKVWQIPIKMTGK